jgi:hypothetical protein
MEGYKQASKKQKGGEAHLRASKRLQCYERKGREKQKPCAQRRGAREGEAEEEEEEEEKAGRKTTTRKKKKKKGKRRKF